MERFRRKRSQSARLSSPSKVTTIVDRSLDDKLIASDRPHGGGCQTAKQKSPKLESGSCYRGRITEEHQIAFELGQGSSVPTTGTLMKSLLANEMSKETESKRRTPSVIAKLMGLDGMPNQQSAYKQSKRCSDGFHQKTVSAGSFRHRKVCDSQSCQKLVSERSLFKDVYEVREGSKDQTDGCTSQVPANRRHAEDEMAYTRQKSMDANRLSTDEKLHDSKVFHEAIEVFDSSNDHFLKFLEEPDSLFAKHLHDLHASQQSRCVHVRNLRMPSIFNDNIDPIGCQTGRGASKQIDISTSHECQMGRNHHISHRRANDSGKSANSPAEINDIASRVPTKIVLLKPNLGASHKAKDSSSCQLLSDVDAHKNIEHRESELWGEKSLPISVDVEAQKSQESEKIAKEITRQMRNKLGEISFNIPLSGNRGYYADESSHEVSANESSYESDVTILTPYRPRCCRKSSASRYTDSSVNKEGTKRLSDRWKMTCRPEDIGGGAKGNTLGEMLAIHDPDIRLRNLDGEMNLDKSPGRLNRNKFSNSSEPLGISSKDGWKEGCIGTLSRSKSLPTAYNHIQSPETRTKYEACGTERFLIPREGSRSGRKKGVQRDFSWKEGSSSGVRSLGDKEPHSYRHINKEMVNDPQGFQVRRNRKKNIIVEAKEPSICNTVNLESPTCQLDSMLNLDTILETEHEKIPVSVRSGDDLMPALGFSTSLQVKYDSGSSLQALTQYPGVEPESPASSKEAEQPSPVSVLDAPFVEDLSSGSECFGRVSAELHGLRMQLQLLKLETGAYGAGRTLISGDEDIEEGCAGSSGEPKASASAESWKAAYMADMLAELEFDHKNPTAFTSMWHSFECPVGPWVFEKLEKKYSHHCPRPDRRHLFDHINSGILEIARCVTAPHQWVKPPRSGTTIWPRWNKAWFEAELHKLLATQAMREKDDMAIDGMEVLQSNAEWMNLGEYVDGIGYEIEKTLLDELISEALTM